MIELVEHIQGKEILARVVGTTTAFDITGEVHHVPNARVVGTVPSLQAWLDKPGNWASKCGVALILSLTLNDGERGARYTMGGNMLSIKGQVESRYGEIAAWLFAFRDRNAARDSASVAV